MSSIPLPRVLHPRKTSLEVQRENFEKFQNQSINKAVNSIEIPVKEKHVRSTIIGTFQERGAGTFWVIALRLPLQDNRIVAWKFCHVLHKVLREGHPNCLQQSIRQKDMLLNLGKLWVHLKEGYGKLIKLYCALLVTKINFHDRNPKFPGNLQLTGEELDAIGENDINNYFEMSVEIFDYMDEVLALQGAIYDSLDITRTSSMTSSGQCRLAPLIPCIQDSNQLYDFSVKLLFKLHSMLPPDTLSGHRERFLKQFKLLKKFYQTADNMQYFKNLISIPSIPENPPNFLIQSELRAYVPPVVILPPEEQFNNEQDIIANLVDTSDNMSQISSPDTPSDFVDNVGSHSSRTSDLIVERDNLIDHLQSEIGRLRNEIQCLVSEHQATLASLNDQIVLLERDIAFLKTDLENERKENAQLKEKITQPSAPSLEQSMIEKTKAFEEEKLKTQQKFETLKNAYNLMREEHITLLRKKAEVDKQMAVSKKSSVEKEAEVQKLLATINELTHEKTKISDTLVKSSDEAKQEVNVIKQELEKVSQKYHAEIEVLKKSLVESNENLTKSKTEKEVEVEKLQATINELTHEKTKISDTFVKNSDEAKHEINSIKQDLENVTLKYKAEIETLERNLAESNNSLKKHQDELAETFEKHTTEKDQLTANLSIINAEKENLVKQMAELTENYEKQNEMSRAQLLESQKKTEKCNEEISKLENEKKTIEAKLEWCHNEKLIAESDLQDLLQQNRTLDETISNLTNNCDELKNNISKEKENASLAQWSLMKYSILSASDIMKCTLDELDNPAISSLQCSPDYLRSLLPLSDQILSCCKQSLKSFEENRLPTEDLSKDIVKLAHILSNIVIQGVATSNTSKDIVFGEQMAQSCKELASAVSNCISYTESLSIKVRLKENTYQNGDTCKSDEHISNIKALLENISSLSDKVGGQDDIGACDSVEGELANMDKVIEEAATRIEEMLKKSRAADSGVKLEVNEKILDACTSLMTAVRELVKKSRSLQAEIVSLGKGTNTAKEFYKRNHQWTEGLISAAKAVALGANLLFTAADKVVTNGGKLEHVMVASQEIAASTVQLVVASRVRAARGSNCLAALSIASKAVSTATGAVIATAKACAQLVEESEDIDMSGMSLQARRRIEMESRVKVLELEQALATERSKLAIVRRTNYSLADSEANDENAS